MIFRVYKITSPNGLVYIGCTRKSLRQRFSGSYNQRLTEDFEKYGKKNFKIELLNEVVDNSILARKLEGMAIKRYQSTDPQKGYNIDKESDYPFVPLLDNYETIPIVIDCINEEEVEAIKLYHQKYILAQSSNQLSRDTKITVVPTPVAVPVTDACAKTLQKHPDVGISVNEFLSAQTTKLKVNTEEYKKLNEDEWEFDGKNLPYELIGEIWPEMNQQAHEVIIKSYLRLGYRPGDIMSKKSLATRLKEMKAQWDFGV